MLEIYVFEFFEIACLLKNKCYKIIIEIWYMCLSRYRERDSLVNTMHVFGYLYMYNNSNRKDDCIL